MRSCVIGGAGFLGSRVTRVLAETGRDVVVLGRRQEPGAPLPAGVRYVSGDYGNRADLQRAMDGVDEVIHLAYATVPQSSFEDPIFDITANVPASVQLLQWAALAGVAKMVLVSSGGTVYGVAESLPIPEEHPTNPISPYGITKLTIEKYARMFHATSGLPVVIVRPSNAYGEEQQSSRGQGFIAAALRAVLRREEVLIFGPNGTVRDYIHVSDAARGIVGALEHGAAGATYNVGTEIGRSNVEVLETIEPLAQRAGLPLLVRNLPQRLFDVPTNVLDTRKLRDVAGWMPQVDFPSGIEAMFDAALRRLPG